MFPVLTSFRIKKEFLAFLWINLMLEAKRLCVTLKFKKLNQEVIEVIRSLFETALKGLQSWLQVTAPSKKIIRVSCSIHNGTIWTFIWSTMSKTSLFF